MAVSDDGWTLAACSLNFFRFWQIRLARQSEDKTTYFFTVPSTNRLLKARYEVSLSQDSCICNCPDFLQRGGCCEHGRAAISFSQSLRATHPEIPIPNLPQRSQITCHELPAAAGAASNASSDDEMDLPVLSHFEPPRSPGSWIDLEGDDDEEDEEDEDEIPAEFREEDTGRVSRGSRRHVLNRRHDYCRYRQIRPSSSATHDLQRSSPCLDSRSGSLVSCFDESFTRGHRDNGGTRDAGSSGCGAQETNAL